ncbi:polysaccharide deacetylase domain containing protein [Calothrix sp. NIES-4071]|nr:polysaccharide deacetylase domain containing protein [Calothrix sp. NIES-4071]BAZ58140.1 polysaccharide deacetylase domain containing protein [Calothrix sp. NIES-4105]
MKYLLIIIAVLFFTCLIFDKLAKTSKYQLFGQYFTKIKTQEPVVALTYDDGPNPPYTEQLIDVLNQLGVKATFFTIGQNIEAHTQTIQKLIANEHEIGNHSYSHQKLIWKTPAFVRSEIERTDELLQNLGVQQEILFRAPYGYKRFTLPYILNQMQKKNILWSVDPKDYKEANPEVIASHVISNVTPGAIILLHDGGEPGATVAATEIIVRKLQTQGYKFQTVSQMLNQC